MTILDLFKKLVRDEPQDIAEIAVGSTIIRDNEVVRQFISNPANSLLVSFPRTGSHWLRMLMELYFGRPSLKLVFYYPERTDYMTYHTHDLKLDIEHPTVIYLYRDPVDTVYSQLSYYQEPRDSVERIAYWSDLYGCHLDKWLALERFTTRKTILRYEGFKQDTSAEFSKVTRHFGQELDAQKLAWAVAGTTKEEIKRKTPHDPRVISTQDGYEPSREDFRARHADLVWTTTLQGRGHLKEFFES